MKQVLFFFFFFFFSVQLNTKVPTIQIVQKISSKLPKNAIIPKIFITTRNQSTKKGNKKLELEN